MSGSHLQLALKILHPQGRSPNQHLLLLLLPPLEVRIYTIDQHPPGVAQACLVHLVLLIRVWSTEVLSKVINKHCQALQALSIQQPLGRASFWYLLSLSQRKCQASMGLGVFIFVGRKQGLWTPWRNGLPVEGWGSVSCLGTSPRSQQLVVNSPSWLYFEPVAGQNVLRVLTGFLGDQNATICWQGFRVTLGQSLLQLWSHGGCIMGGVLTCNQAQENLYTLLNLLGLKAHGLPLAPNKGLVPKHSF